MCGAPPGAGRHYRAKGGRHCGEASQKHETRTAANVHTVTNTCGLHVLFVHLCRSAAARRISDRMNPVIIIPARMASTRLPGKPVADINGEPMIVRVWRQAIRASLGPVLVAAAEPEVEAAVERAGGQVVMTDPT